jgi:hypothetical protein
MVPPAAPRLGNNGFQDRLLDAAKTTAMQKAKTKYSGPSKRRATTDIVRQKD